MPYRVWDPWGKSALYGEVQLHDTGALLCGTRDGANAEVVFAPGHWARVETLDDESKDE